MIPEWDWLVMDIVVSTLLVFAMCYCSPTDKLALRRPTASLLGVRTVSSVVLFAAIFNCAMGIALFILWRQPWYSWYDPLEVGVPAHEWSKKGDNYDVPVVWLCLCLQLVVAAFGFSMGGEQRRSVWRNPWVTGGFVIMVTFLFVLVWGGPTPMHCVFRINCDSETSSHSYLPVIQELSTGNVGGCFVGPQILEWKEKYGKEFELPDLEKNQCRPHPDVDPAKEIRHPSGAAPWIGRSECIGPNNCYPSHFRWILTWVMLGQIFLSLIIYKLMLLCKPGQRVHFKRL